MYRLNVLYQFQPAFARKRNVDQHKIGRARVQGIERLGGIFRFATNDQIRLMIDDMREARTSHRMIVDDQHTGPLSVLLRQVLRLNLNEHVTVVPLPFGEPILRVAPIISARYSIIRKPSPPSARAPSRNPAPLSQTLSLN